MIGWSGYNIPEEVIYALGIIPIRIGAGGDDRLVELGSRYISTKNCVFVRETVGLFAENKDPYIQNIDLVAFDATCLQAFRTAEVLEFFFKKKVIILGVPRNFHWDEAKTYFTKEVEYFTKRLEDFAGIKLDDEKLIEAINLYNKTRNTIKEIYNYQAEKNSLISWEDSYEVIQAGYYLDRKEFLNLLEDLLTEIKGIQPNTIIDVDFNEDEARIFISGSVIPPGDKKLINGICHLK
ncbi:2-hydroxyacyl-CoA dehydratase family protein [Clostridium arbusti]|uniref:2-hydroxyacyl-CoA dehydratase family protein n=1 Tax=Clostridium arbusti TaxID=1137848 RepID=UPI00028A070A|nr:2-hydroxyacyl-CoA dehydratase family protein [Clostridium arbusti]